MLSNGPVVIKPKGSANDYSLITVGAGETKYSEAYSLIDLNSFALEYQAACTGTPNVKLKVQQSTDNVNWYTPDTFADIKSSLTDKNLHGARLAPIPVQYLRISAQELTTTVTDTVITVRLSVQKRFTV